MSKNTVEKQVSVSPSVTYVLIFLVVVLKATGVIGWTWFWILMAIAAFPIMLALAILIFSAVTLVFIGIAFVVVATYEAITNNFK